MSTSKVEPRTQIEVSAEAAAETKESPKPEIKKKESSLLDEFLKLISSVKFGIALLVLLMIFSMIGTFIVQQGTSDFAKFFESLTPAEVKLYQSLGFFDIYHSWYFNLLLLTLSLNIILASIDRAPGHWHFFVQPKVSVSETYTRHQPWNSSLKLPNASYTPEFVKTVSDRARRLMLPRWALLFGPLAPVVGRLSSFRLRVTESKEGATTVFVERGVWNRYAFLAVHVALLMILIGWFVGNKWGQKGVVTLAPGEASSTFISPGPNDQINTFKMPFRLVCYDIQQELMDASKPDLSPQNTLDWHTRLIFDDNGKKYKGDVHLNEPVDFRGYRLFQASFDAVNTAREITLLLTPKDGQGQAQEVVLKRDKSIDVPGLGKVQWKDFYSDFRFNQQQGKAVSASGNYTFPVAEVEVQQTDGTIKSVYGFSASMLEQVKQAPFLADKINVGNYNVALKDFEKVSRAHTIQIQFDPGVNTIYAGCTLLVLTLIMVFFNSHERIWIFIKPGQPDLQLHFAGNTNRNRPAFEVRYNQLVNQFLEGAKDVKTQKPEKDLKETKEDNPQK